MVENDHGCKRGDMVSAEERRRSRRVNTAQSVRVQPYDEKDGKFSDVTPALDAARDGISFASKLPVYYLGMKVRVAYPYSAAVQMNYIGKVVRIQRLDDNFQRISIYFKTRA